MKYNWNYVQRRTEKGCRQRWRLRILNSSRRMVKFSRKIPNFSRRMPNSSRRIPNFSDKPQNFERGLFNSTDN